MMEMTWIDDGFYLEQPLTNKELQDLVDFVNYYNEQIDDN